jgi:N-acetylglucosamine-6-sulfatase
MKKPNLIYVFADQWRKHAMGFMKEDPVITPNIDNFAKESVVVDNAISVCPLCSPHRASLFTGKYPISTGVYTNCKQGLDVMLSPNEQCIGNVLKSNDYQTGYIGKWHLDNPEININETPISGAKGWDAYTPPGDKRQGFDFWYSYGADNDHMEPHYWTNSHEQINIKKWSVEHETDIAIDFIKNTDKEKPFALFLSYNPPHSPYDLVPDEYKEIYKDLEYEFRPNVQVGRVRPHTHPYIDMDDETLRRNQFDYFAAVSGIDENFGRLLDTIKSLNLEDDTIIVLSADHGDMLGSQGLMAKHVWYEESIGIPFIIKWKGKLKSSYNDVIIDSADQMPTLLGLMDIEIPDSVEGKNKSEQLITNSDKEEDYTVIGCYPGAYEAVSEFRKQGINNISYGWRGIRTKRYTYVIHKGYATECETQKLLYDLGEDPYQMNPIIIDDNNKSEQIIKYEKLLIDHLKNTNDPFIV